MAVDEDQLDEGYSPTPVVSSPPDEDLELDLQDQATDRDTLVIETPPPVALGRSPAYDFVRRAFIPGAAGGPLMISGDATLMSWCEKCLRTVQGENPSVDPSFGLAVSLEELLLDGGPADLGAAAEAEAVIVEAFTQHPRIADVTDFLIDWDESADLEAQDAIFLSYTIIKEGDEDDEPILVDRLPYLLGGDLDA